MELIKKELNYYQPLISKRVLHDESSDMIVPDSYPDIAKFSGTSGCVFVKEISIQNGRVLVSGTVKASVFYIPEEGGKLKVLDIPISFAHIEESAEIESGANADVSAEIIYLEPSMPNPRKLSVKACIALNISVYGQKQINITTDVLSEPNEHIQINAQQKQICYPTKICNKSFSILDSVDFGNAKPAGICFCNPKVYTDDVRILAGKIIVKGSLRGCELIYDEQSNISSKENSTSFTQIIEVDGIDPDYTVDCGYYLKDIDFQRDNQSEKNLFDMRASVEMFVKASKCENIAIVNDLFSTRWETENKIANEKLCDDMVTMPIRQTLKELIAPQMPASSIFTYSANFGTAHNVNGEINSEIYLSAVFSPEDGQLSSVSKTTPVTFKAGNIMGDNAKLSVENLNVSVSADGKVSFDGDLICEVSENTDMDTAHLVASTVFTDIPNKNIRQASVILRYAEQGENLWNTAKEYCSSIHDIEEANGITDEKTIEAGTLLLIPLKK